MVSQDVKLLLGALVVVSLPLEPDPDPVRGGSDTSGPDGLVKTGGDPDVLDTHRLLGKLDDRLDGLGSPCCIAVWSEARGVSLQRLLDNNA